MGKQIDYNQPKEFMALMKGLGLSRKANEVMHTGNTGAGAEFVPSQVFANEIFDIVPNRGQLLPLLQTGFHGRNLPKTYTAPVKALSVGDVEFEGRGEWTTGTGSETENDHSQKKATTKSMTITQAGFIAEINLSRDQLRYSGANIEQYVRDALADGMAYTADAVIINGDSETGATGNVNLDDAAPASSKYYLKIDGGIRERAINGSYTKNAGTLAAADYSDLMGVLGQYGVLPEELVFLQGSSVTHKARSLSDVLTVDKLGANATILKGQMGSIFGVPILTHRAVPKTEADGKVSTTAGNNTLGQILCLYKRAAQWGFGADYEIEAVRVAGYGWRLVATFDMGFTIVDSANSLTDPTVAAAINVTVA